MVPENRGWNKKKIYISLRFYFRRIRNIYNSRSWSKQKSGSGFTTVLKSSYNFCAAPVLVSFYLLFLFRRPHFSVVVLSFLIWTLYILYCSSYSQCKNMQLFPALTKHLVSMTTTVRHGCWYFFNITLGLVVTFKNIYNHQGSKRHFWETA